MKDFKRAERRDQQERIKRKRCNMYHNKWAETPIQKGKLANTGTLCSCYMCGNPRKYFGEETIQERRNKQRD